MRLLVRSGIVAGMLLLFFARHATLGGDAPTPPPPPPLKPLLFFTGPASQIREAEYHRITTVEKWQQLWLRHHGKTGQEAFDERLARLDVDFENYQVIAIFQGAGINSRGLTIESITENEEVITVRFDEWQYQSSGGADHCTAYGFVLLPKSKKPIVLEEDVQRLKDQPRKWKERARLE